MTTPADHTDEAVRDTLRAIGDAAGPAPAFERLTLPDAPVLTATPDERRPRRALIAAIAAASLAVGGIAGWQVLREDHGGKRVQTKPGETEASTPLSSGAIESGWSRVADSPLSPRIEPVVVWTGSEVVVIGGGGDNMMCPPSGDCGLPDEPALFVDGAALNTSTDSWRKIADAPVPVWEGQAVAVDGEIYVTVPCRDDERYRSACPRRCRARRMRRPCALAVPRVR